MPQPTAFKSRPLNLESLESREVPAAGDWLVEPFTKGITGGMPTGWSQWAFESSTPIYQVDQAGQGLGGQGRLVSSARSVSAGRAWVNTNYNADVEASAAVFVNNLAPTQLFIRGNNLNSDKPTYFAASVVRGTEVQLLQVVNGTTTVLGTVKSSEYLSNAWITVKIRAEGNALKVFLYRGDTNQYLGSNGRWSSSPAAAIERTSSAVMNGGYVGFNRPAGISGDVPIDSLRIGSSGSGIYTPIREERFDGGPLNRVPDGWSQWIDGSSVVITRRADATLDINANSTSQARVWMTQPVPTDVQVSSSIFVDGIEPAGVFARGSGVATNKPTFYSVTVKRGLEVELNRVVNGVTTKIGSINSSGWQSSIWVQVSLIVKGNQLRVQLYRSDTGQYLNSNGSWGLSPAWAIARTDDAIRSGGLAGLSRGTGAAGDLLFDNFLVNAAPTNMATATLIPTQADKASTIPGPVDNGPLPTVPPVVPPTVPPVIPPTVPPTSPPVPANPALPKVERNYEWIRLAALAYHGTPMTAYEQALLKNSIDLVIPNIAFLDQIAKISPNTPQMVYTNLSNIYGSLLTDWLAYADRNKLDRESIFYHVTSAQPFDGLSASAVPVDQFWQVLRGAEGSWADITRVARIPTTTLAAPGAGQSITLGYTEKFRELKVGLRSAAAGSWNAVLEYVSAVDSSGRPTAWKTMPLLGDGSTGLRKSGSYLFDPPRDWVTSTINNGARLYHVRLRTTNAAGTPPVIATMLTTDYTNFDAVRYKGTIPAFDAAADKDGDGYLNNAEYANRKAGFDARFVYQSRLTFPYYGPNRFATNPGTNELRLWAIDYHQRLLRALPAASGFFVDNSTGRFPVNPATLKQSIANYATDYGNLLGAVNRALGDKWLITNTAGGGTSVDSQIKNGVTNLEEFALRPQQANFVMFEDLAATVAYRRALSGGKSYQILDSLPTTLDASNPRFMTSTLAMYYLLADPKLDFLMINGGNEPATSWKRHFTDAVTFNVGKPLGTWGQFASGRDPANLDLHYRIYQRAYENALVLYKPLSYVKGFNGTIADNTATVHQLNGLYRVVNHDGTLGPAIRQIALRNGEGVVLAKA
jgi:hypothetical protein